MDRRKETDMSSLEKFKKCVRWHCWAHGKVPLFCMTMFYLILKQSSYSINTFKEFLVFLVFIILVSIYGYLINDLFDIKIDKIHGKKNVFENMGKHNGSLIVFLILVLSSLFGLYFVSKDYFLFFLIMLYFCATFYSASPIRFKERGIAGLFIVFLAQYPIPVIMIFSVFDSFGTIDMWGFALFASISGATQEIGHQRSDLDKDSDTGTNTFAVKQGHSKIDRLYRKFIFLDMLSMIGILIIMNIQLKAATVYGQIEIILPLLLYLLLAFGATRKIIYEKTHVVDPYFIEGRNDIFNLTFTLFPNFFLPFYLSCLVAVNYPLYIALTAVFLVITYISFPGASIIRQIGIVYNELITSMKRR